LLALGHAINAKQSMANSRRARGFRTERVVADYLGKVWSFAQVGRGFGKDILNVPFDVEVKARTGFQPKQVLEQIAKRTAVSGELGFAVLRLNGQGEDAGSYACIIQLQDLLPLLELRYGHLDKEPTDADMERCSCGSWMIRRCFTCQPTITNAEDAD